MYHIWIRLIFFTVKACFQKVSFFMVKLKNVSSVNKQPASVKKKLRYMKNPLKNVYEHSLVFQWRETLVFDVIYQKSCPSNTKLFLGCKVVCHLRFFLLKWSLCEDSKGKWYKIKNCSALVIIFDDILFILQLAKLWNFYCKKLHIMTLFMHGKIIKVAPGFNLKVWKNHRVALLYRNIKIDGERG